MEGVLISDVLHLARLVLENSHRIVVTVRPRIRARDLSHLAGQINLEVPRSPCVATLLLQTLEKYAKLSAS